MFELIFLLLAVVYIFLVAAMWKVFEKAGQPGWAAVIPVYNSWVTFEISGKPGWWALVALVPVVNFVWIVLWFLACMELALRFGKSEAWGIVMLGLFSFIGWPMLGFGDAQYRGAPGAGGPTPAAPAPGGPVAPPPAPPAGPAPTSPVQ